MMLLGLAGAYFTLLVGGAGVALWILTASKRLNLIECACLAWLFGAGVVSLLLWLGGTFTSGIALQCLVAALCLALGIVGWRTKQRRQGHFSFPLPKSTVEWVLATTLLLELFI